MAILSTSRTKLDSIVYWGVFIFLSCMVTFFLNSMINLANAEEHQDINSNTVNNTVKSIRLHSNRINSTPLEEVNESSSTVPADDFDY